MFSQLKCENGKCVYASFFCYSPLSSFSFSVPPKVELHLGSTLNAGNIKEGDDVYFECKVIANPEHHKIIWKHNVSKRRSGYFFGF